MFEVLLSNKHNSNSYELCRSLNKEFCISQMNNSYATGKIQQKRRRWISIDRTSKFLERQSQMRYNKLSILNPTQILEHYIFRLKPKHKKTHIGFSNNYLF